MRVYISNYRDHWISPYTILEKIIFWREIDYNEPLIEKWSNRLEPISKGIQWFLDFVRPRVVDVKIDYWDTWSMDATLTPIILPMLKQLRDTKHGSGWIDPKDVPEYMRTSDKNDTDYGQQTFDFYNEESIHELKYDIHDRYDWALNEMIFAFECLYNENWDEQFWDKDNRKCDWNARQKIQDRIDNGLRLFGKYYQTLWD
jgi:hypothetical protein